MTTILKYVKPAHAVKSIVCLVLCGTSDDQVLLDTRFMIHIEVFSRVTDISAGIQFDNFDYVL